MNWELAILVVLVVVLAVLLSWRAIRFAERKPAPHPVEPAADQEITNALIILATRRIDWLIADINRGGAMTDDVINALLDLRNSMTKVGAV